MTTLAEAKLYLRQNWEEGVKCPCCQQLVKLYKYRLGFGMAKVAIDIYRLHKQGYEWVHVQSQLKPRNGDYAKLRHWGLLESRGDRVDDGNSAAYWRLTNEGIRFVLGLTVVPSHAYLYDSKCMSHSQTSVTIREALGKKFNYDELMKGV